MVIVGAVAEDAVGSVGIRNDCTAMGSADGMDEKKEREKLMAIIIITFVDK
jgi:hypothetical protein